MNKLSIGLALALAGSLALNVYQWRNILPSPTSDESSAVSVNTSIANPHHSTAPATSNGASQQTATTSKHTKAIAISAITALLESGDYAQAQQRLQQALRQSPDNFVLLMLEARLLRHTAALSDVVLHYYNLLDYPLSAAQTRQVIGKRDNLVEDALEQLKRAGSWDAMAVFLEPLVQRDPLQADYALWLATAYGKQARYSAMESALAALDYDDSRAQRIRQQFALPDAPSRTATTAQQQSEVARRGEPVSLVRQGVHFIVPVQLNRQPAQLLLDTGATRTAITQAAFNRLSQRTTTRFVGNFTIHTAGGPAEAALIELDRLSLGSYQMTNVRVFVLPVAQLDDVDGLLGMNVLGRFIFSLDQQAGTLWLSPSD
ncbi:retropepsin-like aspartic protease family protein [Salinimonas lutimaris]|uniref:retropepsin-like aspartic protease family protein n=1 Tax=Salinimonas lutimaris TaxID=914153 RepID=UPI0010C0DC35|nr:retropepsin-like aspartic protease [Salinimonas lutimaris]